jgi:dihydrofolate synthase/folylpolyglutamate synthase
MPRFESLADWLTWQERLHPRPVDLGLERVGAVAARMGLADPGVPVISVAGTNGKGSSVAMLEAVYRAAGYRTGCYTSPHLSRYNERIRIDGVEASDAALCAAFARIDHVRADISLSYFEFGTLAALELFRGQPLDVLILEVGLGGRLDAVNLVDADVALVTSIGLDHTEYLGPDRGSIAREKAGIFRTGRPAICADPAPPPSLQLAAQAVGAQWLAAGQDFHFSIEPDGWSWQGNGRGYESLPVPALPGLHQLANAAGVVQVIECLQPQLPLTEPALRAGLHSVRLAGRCETRDGLLLDVAHNPDGAAVLAQELRRRQISGRTRLVLGMLRDKDVAGFASQLVDCVDDWHAVTLAGPRGLAAQELAERLGAVAGVNQLACHGSVCAALEAVRSLSGSGDRVVVCGSFLTVAEALTCRYSQRP